MAHRQLVKSTRRGSSQGTALIEFAIVMGIMTPLFFGMVAIGLSSTSAVQTTQLTRDLGHMYSLGVDFSSATTNDEEAQTIAMNLPLTANGDGLVIFTQIKEVTAADCIANGFTVCANTTTNHFVITQRLTLGNPSLKTSSFGNPSGNYTNTAGTSVPIFNSQGNAAPDAYLKLTSMVASLTSALPGVATGNPIYVTESYFRLPSIQYLSPFAATPDGVYTICYF